MRKSPGPDASQDWTMDLKFSLVWPESAMAKKRGNPRWGQAETLSPLPIVATSFEQTVRTLRLLPTQYRTSAALREWVQKNKNQRYVPPELLALWGFEVKTDF